MNVTINFNEYITIEVEYVQTNTGLLILEVKENNIDVTNIFVFTSLLNELIEKIIEHIENNE